MRWRPRRPVICLVTDRRRLLPAGPPRLLDGLIGRIRAGVQGGVQLIHIRERDLDDRSLVSLVRDSVAAVRDTAAAVVVNDRVDVAMAAGAAGVHLRADSVPASRVRAMVPDDFVVGRSVHSLAEAQEVAADGACDYLVYGTVFPSAGKPDGHPVAGTDALAAVCRAVAMPVIAIGGVTASRAWDIAAAGAFGLAAVGVFMEAATDADVQRRAAALAQPFDRGSRVV